MATNTLCPTKNFLFPTHALSEVQVAGITKLNEEFYQTDDALKSLITKFHIEMEKGLAGEAGDLLMVPAYVTGRSTGEEVGNYLALDFGGTNCRICLVKLLGNQKVELQQEKFKFSQEQLKEHGETLFLTIAQFIQQFLEKLVAAGAIVKTGKPLQLGFTFSFPVNQTSINSGCLVRWTKGFENPGVVGEEVVSMLQIALDKTNVNVKVNAMVNDTVGTLVTSGYYDPTSQVGLILGTGTNAAYFELTKNITKLGNEYQHTKEMAINIEWGAFDNKKRFLPLTKYDEEMDQLTWNPNQQIFEKTVSGYYLGELFRIIISHFHKEGIVFQSSEGLPSVFTQTGGIDTAHLSALLTDSTPDMIEVAKVVSEGFKHTLATPLPLGDRIVLRKVAEIVGHRAAQFAATASTAVILKRKDLLESGTGVTVGVDGSVYEHFPYFSQWMDITVNRLVGDDLASGIKFAISKDGSGIGAALISMIASNTE